MPPSSAASARNVPAIDPSPEAAPKRRVGRPRSEEAATAVLDQYDADGLADGHITALGAAAKMPLSIVGQAPPQVESHGFWF
ncbi:hypothetical protein ET532_021505 [Verminephrobacter sp. Larva24]|nr:hypothetical protein ET532_021505 [Verminephrobacter sp. Larva24]